LKQTQRWSTVVYQHQQSRRRKRVHSTYKEIDYVALLEKYFVENPANGTLVYNYRNIQTPEGQAKYRAQLINGTKTWVSDFYQSQLDSQMDVAKQAFLSFVPDGAAKTAVEEEAEIGEIGEEDEEMDEVVPSPRKRKSDSEIEDTYYSDTDDIPSYKYIHLT
jgi:hypothetical protein